MKSFVFIFTIFLIVYNVKAFEYQEDYNTEDERRSFDYYREMGEEALNYGPVLTPLSTPINDNSNWIPNEENVKVSDQAPEIPEVVTEVVKDSKKPYYEEKDAPELFQKFIKDFNKQYKDDEEYNKRYQNFVNNLKVINP